MTQLSTGAAAKTAQEKTQEVAATVGRHIGMARAAKNNGDTAGTQNHAQAALDALKSVELNYENLDWRQLAEGDAQLLIGNLPGAEKAYRQAMVAAPQQPGGYRRLAELFQETGRTDDLKKHIELCLKKFPADPFFLKFYAVQAASNQNYDEAIPALAKAFAANNEDHETADALGVCLQNINHYNEAILYHAHALGLQPTNPAYAVRYGLAFAGIGEHEAAIELFRLAINLAPDFYDAYAHLGYELQRAGQTDAALEVYQQGLERAPDNPTLNFNYGRLLQETGKETDAIKHYDMTISSSSDSKEAETASFLRASLSNQTPETAPHDFVKSLFDFYAPNFEDSLVNNLQYRAPGVLRDLLLQDRVASVRNLKNAKLRVLDLGCGTGLMGVVIKPYAESMIGVDLSANMLARATEKGVYDDTRRQDIESYLAEMPSGGFELVLAADVFIYVGALEKVFAELGKKLSAKSLFAFATETLPESAPEASYALRNTVRYAHKDSYIAALAQKNGFELLTKENSPLRTSAGAPVDGSYFVLGKK